jgi:DNA-binding XRE family transcriptional regulator
MISGLTQEQFTSLPVTSLHYPCDTCGKKRDYGSLMRDISDYSVVDGEIIEKEASTALYLCSGCHWQMTCEYRHLERECRNQRNRIMSNEAQWLRKLSCLPVQELAERMGVSRQSYHKWLKGKTITPEHKARLKEMIAPYIQEENERGED